MTINFFNLSSPFSLMYFLELDASFADRTTSAFLEIWVENILMTFKTLLLHIRLKVRDWILMI